MSTATATPLFRSARDSESHLLVRYAAGDTYARDELFRRLLPVSRNVARRYARSAQEIEDLEQVAGVGLLKAIDRFDPANGASLSSYAATLAAGEIKHWFRDSTWAIKVSRVAKDLLVRIDSATSRLAAELRRSPTVAEIAEELEVDDDSVINALEARSAASVASLDQTFDDNDDSPVSLFAVSEEPGFDRVEMRSTLDQTLRGLTRRERLVLELRYSEGLSQAEIGNWIGISQMHVSRILRSALDRASLAVAA